MVLGQLSPRKTASRIIVPQIIAREQNFPRGKLPPHHKFSSKIIALTQVNSPQRVLRVDLRKLCIVYEHYCLRLSNHSTKNIFQGSKL